MALYEAAPEEGAGQAVIVIQEAFGVNDHIEDVTRRFAAEGYLAVAPHLFHRTGDGVVPYGEFGKVLEHFAPLDDERFLMDVDAALGHLAATRVPSGRTGIVGFCMGGRVTFLVAARRALGAAVGFYGGGIVTQRFPQFPPLLGEVDALRTPWLGLFGGRDESIPVVDVVRLEEALKGAPVPTEVVLYPEAGHGFFCDQRDAYHPAAAADAWTRTLGWLSRHLGS
ncbi:MAG: carboxymethylenebutenolidase [Chloroflexota bacterium]